MKLMNPNIAFCFILANNRRLLALSKERRLYSPSNSKLSNGRTDRLGCSIGEGTKLQG